MSQTMLYDVQQYICPLGQSNIYRLDSNEICQCKYDAQGYGRQYKNHAYEEIWVDNQFVYRGMDTSSLPNNEVYAHWTKLPDGTLQYGAPWAKRWMALGEVFIRQPHVIHYRANGEAYNQGDPVTFLRLKAHYPIWTAKSGRTVNDVLELQYAFNTDFSNVKESYFYARGFGLVGFKDDHMESSITQDTPPTVLSVTELGWFARPAIPPLAAPVSSPMPSPIPMPMQPVSAPINHVVFIRGVVESPAITSVNVRSAPRVASDLLFKILVGSTSTCTEIRPDEDGDNFLGQVYDWFFLTFPDGRQGWVRNDLLDMQGNFAHLGYGNYGVRTFAFFAAQLLGLSGAPAVSPMPTSPAVTAPPASPGNCTAIVRPDIVGAKVRQAPSRQSAEQTTLNPGTQVTVRHVSAPDIEGFRWVYVAIIGVEGYVREDLLQYAAACMALGLTPSVPPPIESPDPRRAKLYGPPLKGEYTPTTGYQPPGHKGVDLALDTGAIVYASAKGLVVGMTQCRHCTAAQPSAIQ